MTLLRWTGQDAKHRYLFFVVVLCSLFLGLDVFLTRQEGGSAGSPRRRGTGVNIIDDDEDDDGGNGGENYRISASLLPRHGSETDEVDARPSGLLGDECVAVRFRGVTESGNSTMTVDQALEYIRQQEYEELRVGLSFVEAPDGFWSLHHGFFHLYHFLEFVVVAYETLHQLAASVSTQKSGSSAGQNRSSLLDCFMPIRVPWIYVPLMTQKEICGTADGINCLVADLILQASTVRPAPSSASSSQRWITSIHGLESNDLRTRSIHPAFRGNHTARIITDDKISTISDPSQRYRDMAGNADAVIFVNRTACVDHTIHKMWWNHIDRFPTRLWYEDVSTGIASSATTNNSTTFEPAQKSQKKLVVGYVDRQSSDRSLPDSLHNWIVHWFSSDSRIDFRHLRMENYTAIQQIQLASQLDVLMGMHGNGLSHLMWMKPNRTVVELFWQVTFHYDYATACELMGHTYLGIFNGEVLDPRRIRRREKSLRKIPKMIDLRNETDVLRRIDSAERSIVEFVEGKMLSSAS